MPIRIQTAKHTDPGRIRERNEDASMTYVASGPQAGVALLIVADGMGGYRAGDRASELTVETIFKELEPALGPTPASGQPTIKLADRAATDGERSTVELPETADSAYYGQAITRAVRQANTAIRSFGRAHRDARGLGSTVTLALIVRDRAYIANVGDSRSYLFRNGELRLITRDHSLVARLVESGAIEQDEVYTHPRRNLIYRSLGAEDEIEVDLFEETLQSGDMLLLCSDGLWEKVREPDIVAVLAGEPDLDTALAKLIDLANEGGGEDNITAVLAHYGVEPDSTEAAEPDISSADTGEIEATPGASDQQA
jgi:serine/threonine protein phosphatase PrpC